MYQFTFHYRDHSTISKTSEGGRVFRKLCFKSSKAAAARSDMKQRDGGESENITSRNYY